MPIVASYLGLALTRRGRVTDGIAYLDQAIRDAAAIGRVDQHALRLTYLGEAYLDAGRHEEATMAATRAATFAREHEARGEEAWATRLLAEIAWRVDRGGVDTAIRRYGESLALARELGMLPLVAHCHLGIGNLYRHTGEGVKAQEALATAARMYREMNMAFGPEKAEAGRGRVSGA
jgi:tetratricopeptide (TPR) repeat protein